MGAGTLSAKAEGLITIKEAASDPKRIHFLKFKEFTSFLEN